MSTTRENNKAATAARMLEHGLLSATAEARLAERIQTGDETAMHELVRHNLRLAGFMAERFAERHASLDYDDLCSEAVLALYHAARKFDPRRGRFAHYAGFYVRESMRAALNVARYGRRRPAPREDREAVAEAAWRWLERTGREANEGHLANALGWTEARVRRALRRELNVSLDAPMTADGRTLGEVLEDPNAPRADAHAIVVDLGREVRTVLARLDPRARAIIERRFGLVTVSDAVPLEDSQRQKNPRALRAVGASVGLTAERTRQIERSALLALRRYFTARNVTIARRQTRRIEAKLLRRFTTARIVTVDSFVEPGLWFAAHGLSQRGVLRPGPCANTWLLAKTNDSARLSA